MEKYLDLEIYKTTKPYFKLFDILLKDDCPNKDHKLIELGIAPSSYRRSRESAQKISRNIIGKLCDYFKIANVSIKDVLKFEALANQIFGELSYKIKNNIDTYLEEVNLELAKKNLLFPGYALLKLFLSINSQFFPRHMLKSNEELYNIVLHYNDFYFGSLKKYQELVLIYFEKKIDDKALLKDSDDPIYYFILAYRLFFMQRYTDSILIGLKARKELIKGLNFKRVTIINIIIMASYCAISEYQKVHELALNQRRMLESFGYKKIEYENTLILYIVSLVGLGDYKNALEALNTLSVKNQNSLSLELICYYKLDLEKFNDLYQKHQDLELFTAIWNHLINKASVDDLILHESVILLPVFKNLLKRL